MAVLMKVDGVSRAVVPVNGTDFQLDELYKLLECDTIEVTASTRPGWILIIDENGKLKDEWSVNLKATMISARFPIDGDQIAGHALHCKSSELR